MFGKRFQPPQWPALVWVVLAGTFLTRTAFFMVWPFLTVLLARDFALTPSRIGSVLSAMALGSAIVGFYSGNLSDRFGRRTLMVGGSLAAVGAYLTLALAATVVTFAVGAFLVGVSRSSLEAPGKALIADRVSDTRSRELAYHARYFLINAGAAVGPLLGVVFGLAAQQATFLITGAVYGLFTLAIVAAFRRSPDRVRPGARSEAQLGRVIRVLGRDRAFLLLLVAMFLMLVAYSQQESTLVQYITLEGGDAAIGLVTALIMTNALTIVVFQFPFLALMARLGLAARNYIGMSLVATGFLLYTAIPVENLPAWIVAVWILSMGESILFPTLNLQVDRMAPENLKGSYFGAASLSGLGFSAGPLAGGFLLELIGGPWTFALMALVTGLCATCYLASGRTAKGAERTGHGAPEAGAPINKLSTKETTMWKGTIVSTHIALNHSIPMIETDGVHAIAGKGLEGDRYAEERGFFSAKKGPQRQVSLFESEVLDTIRRDQNVELEANECRMNLITRDVPLSHLVGRTFRIGDAVLRGIKINEPCKHLEDAVGKRLLPALIHRCGLHAEILEGGRIQPGDRVEEVDLPG